MKTVRTIRTLRNHVRRMKALGKTVGLVPTMGALHEGHISLVRCARKEVGFLVVSTFVNPTQFGALEDFERYPRSLGKDRRLLEAEGVDILFAPEAPEMYPEGFSTFVEEERLSKPLCGATRPGHFRSVCTVVTKLLHIVEPDRAYFGQKDAQQAAVIRHMARDLDMDIKVVVLPTVRERGGLAASSRNAHLTAEEREEATSLYQALSLARRLVRASVTDSRVLVRRMKERIGLERDARIDYVAVVDPETLEDIPRVDRKALAALAVWIGKTRLIDNMFLLPPK